MSDTAPGTLAHTEPHPAAHDAIRWLQGLDGLDILTWRAAFSSAALSGNRLAEVCSETLRRLEAGEPVSDRYVLGLAWTIRWGNLVMKND